MNIIEVEKPEGVVVAPVAEVRSGPNMSYAANFTVPEGRRILILKEQEPIQGWLEIGVRTNGVGGTVTYQWIRKDSNGTQVQPLQSIIVAVGDTGAHSVAADQWVPASNGSEQLVFKTPSYSVAPQSFTCKP